MKKTHSTKEAAKLIGVHSLTVHRWIRDAKIRPSVALPMGGGNTLWRWTDADIAKGRKVKVAQKPGPKPKKVTS
jgi:hypothetical protein